MTDKVWAANSGSREPDPSFTGSGPSGFDPGREDRLVSAIARALRQYVNDQAPNRQRLEAYVFINNRDDEMARAVLAAIRETPNGN